MWLLPRMCILLLTLRLLTNIYGYRIALAFTMTIITMESYANSTRMFAQVHLMNIFSLNKELVDKVYEGTVKAEELYRLWHDHEVLQSIPQERFISFAHGCALVMQARERVKFSVDGLDFPVIEPKPDCKAWYSSNARKGTINYSIVDYNNLF